MLLSESLTRIRRIVTDRDGAVFSDDFIIRMWNEVQMDFSLQTSILESYIGLPVPPTAFATFTHKWERDFIAKPSNLIFNFLSSYTYTQPWEVVAEIGLTPTVVGGLTISQGWESFYGNAQTRIRHHFPDDYNSPVFAALDMKPIEWVFRKQVEGGNLAFESRTGIYPSIYVDDVASMEFYLYPKVTANYGVTDMNGEFGEMGYDSSGGYAFLTDYGVVCFSTTEEMDSDYGVTTSAQTYDSAIYLIYIRRPLSLRDGKQEIEFPRWAIPYIESGVLSGLFKANTDVYNQILSKHFRDRYSFGIEVVKKYKSKLCGARMYGMEGGMGKNLGIRKGVSLPSHYPSLWR